MRLTRCVSKQCPLRAGCLRHIDYATGADLESCSHADFYLNRPHNSGALDCDYFVSKDNDGSNKRLGYSEYLSALADTMRSDRD